MKLAPPPADRADAAPPAPTDARPQAVPPGDGRRRAHRRLALALRTVAVLFALAGVLILTDGVLTLVWQEPVSGLIAHFDQARLAKSLKALEAARATPADERALAGLPTDNQRIAFFAQRLRQTARAGQPVGRIRIPRIGADFVVVAGTDEASLKKGPGIYSGNAVPGLRGTVGIAGHRTTYLAPFRRINELAPGDRITLEMPYGLFSYTVVRQKIVSPKDVTVLQPTPSDQVVLTACNPLYSAAQRIVVFARLTAAAPAGPALARVTPGAPAGPAGTRPAVPASPPLLSPAAAAATLVGGPSVEPGPTPIGPAEVVLGAGPGQPPGRTHVPARAGAKPGAPAHSPAASRRSSPTRSPTPSPAASRPILRAPIPTPAPTPARTAPSQNPPARVRTPAASPIRKPPAVKAPAPAAGSPAPPASGPSQTRVQGRPGGPVPIIDVPSGG